MKNILAFVFAGLFPLSAWAGPMVPADVVAGVAFPVVFTAEARDGSGPVLAGTIAWAVGYCTSNCTATPSLEWCATRAPTSCAETTPTWFTLADVDSLATSHGQYVDFFNAPAALAEKYIVFFFRDSTRASSTDAVSLHATTLVHTGTRAAIQTDTTSILLDTGTDGVVVAAADEATIAAAVLASVVESQGSITLKQALCTLLSYAAGETTVAGSSATYKTPDGVSTRITGTFAAGERSAITLSCP